MHMNICKQIKYICILKNTQKRRKFPVPATKPNCSGFPKPKKADFPVHFPRWDDIIVSYIVVGFGVVGRHRRITDTPADLYFPPLSYV